MTVLTDPERNLEMMILEPRTQWPGAALLDLSPVHLNIGKHNGFKIGPPFTKPGDLFFLVGYDGFCDETRHPGPVLYLELAYAQGVGDLCDKSSE